jgi:hypothetical protein
VLVLLLGLLAAEAAAQGCAMCGTALGPDDPVTRAFGWSILFLMAAPYTILGLAAGWLYLSTRRTSDRRRTVVVDLARTARVRAAQRGGDLP